MTGDDVFGDSGGAAGVAAARSRSRSRNTREWRRLRYTLDVPSLIEAIEIKRKTFFEFENAPYVCIDVEVSRPTARGGQTLVRLKMRNLLTRAVFDKTFKAGEKFAEPDLVQVSATFLYSDGDGFHFMDQESFETLTLSADTVGDDSELLVDNLLVQILKYNGNPIAHPVPAPRGADGGAHRAGRARRHRVAAA